MKNEPGTSNGTCGGSSFPVLPERWHILRIRHGGERKIRELADKHELVVQVFFPIIPEIKRVGRAGIRTLFGTPMVPGYVFARGQVEELYSLPASRFRFLMDGEKFATISQAEIDLLRQIEKAEWDISGWARNAKSKDVPQFHPGDIVRTRCKRHRGIEFIVISHNYRSVHIKSTKNKLAFSISPFLLRA